MITNEQQLPELLYPTTRLKNLIKGEVVAVGNGKILEDGKTKPVDVKVGEKILFGKYSGQTVKVDGDELLVLREDDIMAIIEK